MKGPHAPTTLTCTCVSTASFLEQFRKFTHCFSCCIDACFKSCSQPSPANHLHHQRPHSCNIHCITSPRLVLRQHTSAYAQTIVTTFTSCCIDARALLPAVNVVYPWRSTRDSIVSCMLFMSSTTSPRTLYIPRTTSRFFIRFDSCLMLFSVNSFLNSQQRNASWSTFLRRTQSTICTTLLSPR